jgi:hypothetical protein
MPFLRLAGLTGWAVGTGKKIGTTLGDFTEGADDEMAGDRGWAINIVEAVNSTCMNPVSCGTLATKKYKMRNFPLR